MKKVVFTFVLLALLACVTCSYAAVSLSYRTYDELGFPSSTGFCATQNSIVAYNFHMQSEYYRFNDIKSMLYKTCELEGVSDSELMIGGDALYVFDRTGNLFQIDNISQSASLALIGTIDKAQLAGSPCKGFLCAQRWLVLLTDTLTTSNLPSRNVYVYDIKSQHMVSIDKANLIDTCLYKDNQCLLLCYENNAYVLYVYDFTSESLCKYTVLGPKEVACITYYEPEDKIYFVRANGLWCQYQSDPPYQEGFTPWQQLRYDVFAFITENGILGLYSNEEIILYSLVQSESSSVPLGIRCPQLQDYCNEALVFYRRAHPEVELQMRDIDTLSTKDYLQLIYKDASLDVLAVDNMELLEILIDKGYCVDLSKNTTIAKSVSNMVPKLASPLCRGEKIYAIPYIASFSQTIPGYNPEVLQMLGLSEADLPATWDQFFDFIEVWAAQPILEEKELSLIRSPYSLYDLRETIFLAITEQQIAYCEQQGLPITLDTPLIRRLLTRLDELSDLLNRVEEDNAGLIQYASDEQISALFILDYEPIVGDGESVVNSHCTIMPLTISPGISPLYPIHQKYIVINSASQHQQEAIQFLEAIVTHLEQKTEMILFPSKRIPVEKPSYQEDLVAYEAWKSSIEQQLQSCADEATYQQLLRRYNVVKEEWDFSLKFRYEVTPDSIRLLHALDLQMVPSRSYHFFFQQSNIRTFYKQYMNRQISASQFLADAERILHMQQLE